MKKVYCISGLAADHRVFKNLSLPGYELIPLIWIAAGEQDDMKSYAAKMVQQINEERAIVIGYSFGGMLAVEIGKMHPLWHIFMISSAKTSAELGYDNVFLKSVTQLHFIPERLWHMPYGMVLNLLGANTANEKALFSKMIEESTPVFNRWCIHAMLNWGNVVWPANVTHIHGTDDKVIRSSKVHPDHWIEKGSHLMVYNRAEEIGVLIAVRLAAAQ